VLTSCRSIDRPPGGAGLSVCAAGEAIVRTARRRNLGLRSGVVIGGLPSNAVVVEYEGPATLGGSGRARLHGRVGGLGEMLWEALSGAGWVGEIVSRWTGVAVRLGVPMAPVGQPVPQSQIKLLPGGVRRLGPGGWIDDQGVRWQQSVGPLNGRAAGPGYRLLESERDPAQLEFYEDMLYTAAVHAGWLSGEAEQVVDVPDVRVAVGVARRNPTWEAYDADPDSFPFSPMDPGELVGAIDESDTARTARSSVPPRTSSSPGCSPSRSRLQLLFAGSPERQSRAEFSAGDIAAAGAAPGAVGSWRSIRREQRRESKEPD
jgi:hypothetical protein